MAQQPAADFVGAWKLVSIETRTEAGAWAPTSFALGGQPVGVIMYDANGTLRFTSLRAHGAMKLPPRTLKS